MNLIRVLTYLLTVFVSCVSYAWASPVYTIFDLGTLGWAGSGAMGISENGMVTGSLFGPSGSHVFIGNENGLIDLGTLGGRDAIGLAVNDSGKVVGRSDMSNGAQHAFIGDVNGLVDLGTFGGNWSQANDINNQGQVTGSASTEGGYTHAFISNDLGLKMDLGTLGGDVSYGTGINESGNVVGYSSVTLGASSPRNIFTGDEFKIESLLAPGDVGAPKLSINNKNQIAGDFVPNGFSSSTSHAFFFDGSGWEDIGTLGGKNSFSKGLNDAGQVVGHSHTVDNMHHAFLYNSSMGELFDLNSLVKDLNGWQYLQGAQDINNRGEIVGYGLTIDGYQHAFLLREVSIPEPPTIVLFLIGALIAIRLRAFKLSPHLQT